MRDKNKKNSLERPGKSTAGRRQKSAKRSAYTQRNNLNDKIKNNAKTTARTTISCGNNTATRLGGEIKRQLRQLKIN
jgi:hypothetical protein